LNSANVIVVVTRWFGGILLGADRFKHIQNVARAIIDDKYQELEKQSTLNNWQ
jgi:putative IMPACT (imprinted ancient) family translation regulator